MGRISEDPQAFAMILKRVDAPVEINGDLSHYIYRNMRNDTDDMKEILGRMGHTHQRMCKPYGDLSANVPDPRADWNSRGLTWKAFQFSKMGLRGGLSSRVIAGESGPMHDGEWNTLNDDLTSCAMHVLIFLTSSFSLLFLCLPTDSLRSPHGTSPFEPTLTPLSTALSRKHRHGNDCTHQTHDKND